jgi:hypothetical protein
MGEHLTEVAHVDELAADLAAVEVLRLTLDRRALTMANIGAARDHASSLG